MKRLPTEPGESANIYVCVVRGYERLSWAESCSRCGAHRQVGTYRMLEASR